MAKVCRLCLAKLQRGSKYFNINAVESFTGFMPYRDQLTLCIPEMALDLISNPVICTSCRNALKSSYDFKTRCLLVEKKIREYVESRDDEESYNLSDIDISDLLKLHNSEQSCKKDLPKLTPILPKTEVQKLPLPSSSILSNLLSVRQDVILPNPSEIEITNVQTIANKTKPARAKSNREITFTPIEKDGDGWFACNRCDKKFPKVPLLHTHKAREHDEDYLCNFCSVSFNTLQSLRKHNQICQKANTEKTPSVLTKRPHLPTKAKNHLKRWLFEHTDHPYPTDVEKQQLMKETNLSLLQVENWFINARRRILADLTRLKKVKRGGVTAKGRSRKRNGGEEEWETIEEEETPTTNLLPDDSEGVECELINFADYVKHSDLDPLETQSDDPPINDEEGQDSPISMDESAEIS